MYMYIKHKCLLYILNANNSSLKYTFLHYSRYKLNTYKLLTSLYIVVMFFLALNCKMPTNSNVY